MFKIVSVRGNSVRVNAGLVSFDVLVLEKDGRKVIQKPSNLHIFHNDYVKLVGVVLTAYDNAVKGKIAETNEKEVYRLS
jgi:hypothetical protein